MYQPDEDPFLIADDGSVSSGPPVQPRNGNYQYQPQSMYQLPVGPTPPAQQPYPQNYPPNAQPRRLRPNPSMYGAPTGMPPLGPVPAMRAAPSFYGDPMMGQPVMGQPLVAQPYGAPVQAQAFGYGQPAPMPRPGPVYGPPAGGYRDVRGNILHDQIEEFNRYHSNRPRNNNNEDNSLLIATLVSEQEAMYGTNMLENVTPADLEYIQGLMSHGAPEHEAYRLAFMRKPHPVRPPKVVGETFADKKALEDAIQASLTESSRRASRPDASTNSRADQEALEKAIQLSLQENSSHYSSQTSDNNTQRSYAQESPRYPSSHRNVDVSYSGSEYYSEAHETSRQPSESETRPFDRQYPYNLSSERPIETLGRSKPVNTMTEEDYTRARLLREAEELRARAYGGGSVVSGTSEYSRPYPQHHQNHHNQNYRTNGGGDDDFTVDSRNSHVSHGSHGSRTIDSRSQYSYDRHPQHPPPQQHAYGHGQAQGLGQRQRHEPNHGQYAQNDRVAYTSTSHTAVHRQAPGPNPYPSSNDNRPASPAQYRTEEADYDSQSYSNSDEGKDDFDHRQAFVLQGKKNSRSSNYTSTSSISATDEGDFTPRSNEEPHRSNHNQYGHGGGPGALPYGDNAQYQYPTSVSNRGPMMPSPVPGGNLSRTSSPALNSQNGQLPRVPSFINPPRSNSRSASPAPGAGGPVPTLARVPSFITPRPPVPTATAQGTPRVGIAVVSSDSSNNASGKTTTASVNVNASGANSLDGSVVSSSDPSLPQFERRKTLMRLVSKLTIDSDED